MYVFFLQKPLPFKMECSVASNYNNEPSKSTVSTNGLTNKSDKSTKSGLRVNFTEKGEVKERREKFLTAKYGSHQMSLIRKRLAVEMWLYEEIQKLCTDAVSNRDTLFIRTTQRPTG